MGKVKYLEFPSGVYRVHIGGIFSTLDDGDKNNRIEKLKTILLNDYDNWKNKDN